MLRQQQSDQKIFVYKNMFINKKSSKIFLHKIRSIPKNLVVALDKQSLKYFKSSKLNLILNKNNIRYSRPVHKLNCTDDQRIRITQ